MNFTDPAGIIAGDGNGGDSGPSTHASGGPPSEPGGDEEEPSRRPWWKINISKDDILTYGTAIAISYGIRE